jgi:hypothetical protein
MHDKSVQLLRKCTFEAYKISCYQKLLPSLENGPTAVNLLARWHFRFIVRVE